MIHEILPPDVVAVTDTELGLDEAAVLAALHPVEAEQLEADVPHLTAIAPRSLKLVPTWKPRLPLHQGLSSFAGIARMHTRSPTCKTLQHQSQLQHSCEESTAEMTPFFCTAK